MRTRVEIPPKGSRTCANRDCLRLARPNGWFCSDACRARTWRERHPGYSPPPGQHARQNAAERRSARVSNGGLQVAAGRMLASLLGPPSYLTESAAREHIGVALPERQRGRWVS